MSKFPKFNVTPENGRYIRRQSALAIATFLLHCVHAPEQVGPINENEFVDMNHLPVDVIPEQKYGYEPDSIGKKETKIVSDEAEVVPRRLIFKKPDYLL